MRVHWLCFCVLWLAISLTGSDSLLAAQDASTSGRSEPSAAALRLIVVTDDDFLASGQDAWCARALSRAVEEFRQIRPGTDLELEMRPAGPPAILRSGRPQLGPRRAIGFLCDQQASITAFCVGVPTGRQLAAMVEDADEVSLLRLAESLQTHQTPDVETEPQDRLVETLHERATRRVLRHYRPLVHKIKRQTPLAEAAALLQPALTADRGERFLVAGLPDAARWLSAQQHTETMRHWCEAMLPSIVGQPADAVWQDMAALLWDSQPWQLAPQDADLLDWYTESIAAGPVVLWLQTSQPLLGLPAAPEQNAAAAPPMAAQTQGLLDQVKHRIVTLPAVASLLHHRQDKPADLLRTTEPFTGWVVFAGAQQAPTFVPSSAQRRFTDTLHKMLASP